jgi:hypothetical protein
VRLAMVGGELSEELGLAYAGRCVETGLFLDLCADRQRDVACQRNALEVLRDVEVGLVERKRFEIGVCSAKIPRIF